MRDGGERTSNGPGVPAQPGVDPLNRGNSMCGLRITHTCAEYDHLTFIAETTSRLACRLTSLSP